MRNSLNDETVNRDRNIMGIEKFAGFVIIWRWLKAVELKPQKPSIRIVSLNQFTPKPSPPTSEAY